MHTPCVEKRILIVDDDEEVVALLLRYLGKQGFKVVGARNGAEMRARFEASGTDLILLDLGLPDEDGLALLRYLRTTWTGPVIVLSGRGEPVERVVGLELGADDFISKPFDLRELLARIRSVFRRVPTHASAVAGVPSLVLQFAGFRLDTSSRRLRAPDGTEIPLTTGDYQLLLSMLRKPKQVLTRDELMDALYNRGAGPFDRAVDVGIGRLRKKIEADPHAPRMIRSVRGAGYLLAVDVIRSHVEHVHRPL